MSLLTTIQYFAGRTGLNVPTTVFGTTDPEVRQLLRLLEEEGSDLSGRGDWQELTNEATHTTVATESQGAIKTIASNGFRWIKNDTIWDRTNQLPLYVIDGVGWQQIKSANTTSPNYHVRIRGGNLLSNPVPTAGLTWAFEYVSWNWITDSAGANPSQYFATDTDLVLLPDEIILAGLRWRWKKEKGMEYAEDFARYETLVADALSRNGLHRKLSMSQGAVSAKPGISVPNGSWNL